MTTDYLQKYAPAAVTKHQAGGPVDGAPAGAPAAGAEGGPAQLEQMVMEYAQSRDPQLAVAIADALVAVMQGQGGAPQGGAPAPAMAKGGRLGTQPTLVFRKGGKL